MPSGYGEAVDGRLRNAFIRWLLLVSVALGVVIMHHVMAEANSTVHTAAAMPTEHHPAPDPGPEHDALHLCMAVIQHGGNGVAVLLLLVGMVALVISSPAGRESTPMRSPARPPPNLAGRALLHLVCVARL